MKKHLKKVHHHLKKSAEAMGANPWILISVILGLILIWAAFRYNMIHDIQSAKSPAQLEPELEQYVQQYLTRGIPVKISNMTKVNSGLYSMNVEINGQVVKSYVTVDGKIFFPYGYPVMTANTTSLQGAQSQSVPKTDRPDVKLFVMSYCPYGLQMEKAFLPVQKLLNGKADMSLNYVIYSHYGNQCLGNGTYCSMHGKDELEEDIRQMCIRKLYGNDTFWKYVDRFSKEGSYQNKTIWKSVLSEMGLDESRIMSCVGQEKKELAMLSAEKSLNEKYSVQGSPTLIINGKTMRVSRSPEAVKEAICSAFNNPPAECQQNLSSQSTSPGFGSGAGSGSAGSCS